MKPIYIALACMCGSVTTATAQGQLSKEITIDREIVPEVRAASRLNIYPRTLSFERQTKSLNFNNYTELTNIPKYITTLEPANTEDAATATPYRGYVDGGYFPAANAALSAGYSIVSKESTLLNVWTQLNNRAYKARPHEELGKVDFKDFTGRLGVDFSHRFGESGSLGISTDVALASFNQLWSLFEKSSDETKPTEGQSFIDWKLSAMWHGNASSHLKYNIGLGFNVFNFSKELPAENFNELHAISAGKPLHQTGFSFRLGIQERVGERAAVGVDWNGDFIRFNYFMNGNDWTYSHSDNPISAENVKAKTMGVVSLKPYYRFGSKVVTLKLGARVDYTINSGKKLHIAPDAMFAVNPAAGFGLWLGVGGGEHLNTLQSLAAYSHYISQSFAYKVSHMPIKGEFGLRFGPFKGASLTVDVAYASANNWLMPMLAENQLIFRGQDLRSWKVGAQVNWAFRKWFTFEAGFETLLGSKDKNRWFEWRDRARHVASAAVSVKPLDALTVNLSYEMRMKRSMLTTSLEQGIMFDLDDVNNVGIGASYRITNAFTVFGKVNNLLGQKYDLITYVPTQGVTGLVGVGFKF